MASRRPRRTRATRDEMGQFSDEYLICRDRAIGHDWDIDGPFQLMPRLSGGFDLIRTCRCARCSATRVEYFDHVGRDGYIQKIKQRYAYPEGYQITGIGNVDASAVWTEQVRRADIKRPAKKTARKRAKKVAS